MNAASHIVGYIRIIVVTDLMTTAENALVSSVYNFRTHADVHPRDD